MTEPRPGDHFRLATDIGGTFTDTVLATTRNRVVATAKTLTSHEDPSVAAMQGIQAVLTEATLGLSDVEGFVHGTTLATNALIERRGATVAVVTTEGFRDILEIAYERRYSQYDINISKPDLIVSRARCFTVPERMSVDGNILRALDSGAIDQLVSQLTECEADAVAICLLHSYANPVHEYALRDLLLSRMPDLSISLSSDVSPEAREFDRLCTTIANAYVQPLMSRYLNRLEVQLKTGGLACPILLMTSGGGMTTLETARRFPIRLVESGPAGGAILASRTANGASLDAALSFDMGGTTAKLCLIDGGAPQTSRKFEIARAARFIKGSGMPVRIPVVEMIEIGAGGGSVASVDALSRLTVGPESAGSEPGPAAFVRGGRQATVTDADVVLGYINPETFAEGRLTIDADVAAQAVKKDIAAPLQLQTIDAALGVSEIVDENMASAGRMHSVESGKDLAARTMIAFGGNGPLHATRVARCAGIDRIVIPKNPSVGSAVGFLSAPVSYEIVRSHYALLDDLNFARINSLFDELIGEASNVVQGGAPGAPTKERRSAYMRYLGQGHEIEVRLPDRTLHESDLSTLRAQFEQEYRRQFSRVVPGMKIEILNWSVLVTTIAMEASMPSKSLSERELEVTTVRKITCDVTGQRVDAAIYERAELNLGDCFVGPALVVEPQTTTLVSQDFSARMDTAGQLVLERRP